MKATDLPTLANRLGQLADYYGKVRPTNEALKVWLDVLAGETLDDVQSVLTDWPKSHRVPPTGDEVLKLCRTAVSDRIERQAESNKRNAGTFGEFRDAIGRSTAAEAEQARRDIKEWIEASKNRRLEPKGWARKLRDRELAGERLDRVQAEAWRAVLGVTETEADREARLEREAIQAE